MPFPHRRLGHGPHPVLVLHGWFGDQHALAKLEPWLSLDTFTYVFFDYRGYGARRDTPGAWTLDEIATDTLDLADTLGLAHFSLIGHSMGGCAAERIAARAPGRVRALVAVAPVPGGGMHYDAATRGVLERAARELDTRRAIIDRSTSGRLPAAWLDAKASRSFSHTSREAFAAYLVAWAGDDAGGIDRIDRIDRAGNAADARLPVHVIVGEHDPVFTAERMRTTYLRRYRDASLTILRNAGHYPMNETPLALASEIEAFLLRQAQRHAR